jgi:hypothetical protein
VELRQYTLHPGQRDALVALFEREFVESQEVVGMTLFGQFRDLDAADRFVWLRGFADMAMRADALGAFYGGPVWQAHREAANATMIDSDNVLLLRPARGGRGFPVPARPAPDASRNAIVVATLCYFAAPVEPATIALFEGTLAPALARTGARLLATLVTESSPNSFPRLPVREGEHVLAWFAAFDSAEAHARHAEALAADATWHAAWRGFGHAMRRSETLRLAPTPRSRLPQEAIA